jgi:hypothetical protein
LRQRPRDTQRRPGRYLAARIPFHSDRVVESLPFKYIVHNEIAIFGSRANPNVSRKVVQLISSGQLVVKDLITHVFPLDEFDKALDTFVNRREGAIKVVIEPNSRAEKKAEEKHRNHRGRRFNGTGDRRLQRIGRPSHRFDRPDNRPSVSRRGRGQAEHRPIT